MRIDRAGQAKMQARARITFAAYLVAYLLICLLVLGLALVLPVAAPGGF